jgi:MFS family permease
VTGSLGRRLFLRALVASLSATAALAIGTLLFAEFDDTAGRILATTALISAASLFSLPAGVLLDQGRATLLAWAVLALAAAAFVLSMVLVWGDVEDVWKAVVTLAVFAAASSQTAASTARRRGDDPPGVVRLYLASIVLGYGLATLLTVAALEEVENADYYRFVGAVAVAAVLAALLQPILRRMGGAAEKTRAELVFSLDREPSAEAVERARVALSEYGARVKRR